jgi:hypothetical protein
MSVDALHVQSACCGNGYTLHVVHTAGVGRGYTPCTSILLAVKMDTPCTSILLALEGDTPCTSILLAVEIDTPCTSILLELAVVKGIPNACPNCR